MSTAAARLWSDPDRWTVLALSQVAAVLFISLATLALGPSLAGIILLDAATTQFLYPFTIQNAMHLLFFLGLGELYVRWRCAEQEWAFTRLGLLPEDTETVLRRRDLAPIRQRVAGLHRDDAGHLPYLIAHRVDLRYALSRYLVWVIPTIGFIGTVVGIAMALQQINPEAPDLRQLTGSLGVAFYTTLVALVQSAVLVFGLQIVQAREEEGVNRAGQYVLRHLINRLYAD